MNMSAREVLIMQIENPNKFIPSFFKSETCWEIYFCSCGIALHMSNSVQLNRCGNAWFADIKLWEDFINIFSVDKSC